MADSFFFYDLETSGIDPRKSRVMQFAGQRTDLSLKPVGEPVNALIKLTPDILPDPDAIMLTGITPQQTITEGLTEAEFLRVFYEQVVKQDTIFVGFNTIRFDDEFMRFLNYRNFYDAYEWQWKNGCSRWDLLDVVRMTRALRPEGIEWPFAPNGKPANRLEMLSKVNKLSHDNAHDALSDVQATIDLAKLLKSKQPDLFAYLLSIRDKKKAAELITSGQPFVYTSGRYSSDYLHTSVATLLSDHPQPGGGIVYDLRFDPSVFLKMTVEELVNSWRVNRDPEALRLPVKTVKYNRCPAVAPLGVIKAKSTQERIGLELSTVLTHAQVLKKNQAQFADKVLQAIERLDREREETQLSLVDNQLSVDARLYESFINDKDRLSLRLIRTAEPLELSNLITSLSDERLKSLLPLYKARNYPRSLNTEERAAWEDFCQTQLLGGGIGSSLAKYFNRLNELAKNKLTKREQYLLEELQLYGQSLIPVDVTD
jgi:exodeoxyribonuclease-1